MATRKTEPYFAGRTLAKDAPVSFLQRRWRPLVLPQGKNLDRRAYEMAVFAHLRERLSDTYIALFSRFIACGAWEGNHILDFVTESRSALQPDTLHADTQGQSAPIFGLAHLLGIQLMPRIRNWQDLHFYRPDKASRYEHIDTLFTATVDWELIETLLPDMLRVALSVRAGRIRPSAILRRLGTYSRKNKLYFAFRELGRVVRTIFLLNFLSSLELRHLIQAATNKSELFNKCAQ